MDMGGLGRYIPVVPVSNVSYPSIPSTVETMGTTGMRNRSSMSTRLTTMPLIPGGNVMSAFMYGIFDEVLNVLEDDIDNIIDGNYNFEDVKVTLSKEEFEKLKVVKTDDVENALTKQCHICIEDYQSNEDLIYLDCKHYFHRDCIKKWLLESSSKCPICRKQVSETTINNG